MSQGFQHPLRDPRDVAQYPPLDRPLIGPSLPEDPGQQPASCRNNEIGQVKTRCRRPMTTPKKKRRISPCKVDVSEKSKILVRAPDPRIPDSSTTSTNKLPSGNTNSSNQVKSNSRKRTLEESGHDPSQPASKRSAHDFCHGLLEKAAEGCP